MLADAVLQAGQILHGRATHELSIVLLLVELGMNVYETIPQTIRNYKK